MDDPSLLIARASLGDSIALAHVIARHHDGGSADHGMWRRIIAVRTVLLPPAARAADLALTVACQIDAVRDSAALPSALITALAEWVAQSGATHDAVRAAVPCVIVPVPHAAAQVLSAACALRADRCACVLDNALTRILAHDPDMDALLIHAAAQHAAAARIALAALLGIEGALSRDHARALVAAVAVHPEESIMLIESSAMHWMRLDRESRSAVLRCASDDPWGAMRALQALLPIDGALLPEDIDALAMEAARHPMASASVIEAAGAHWARFDPAAQDALLHAAMQRSDTACHALVALWSIAGALTEDQVHALLHAIVHDAFESAACIAQLAPYWTRVDDVVRQRLLHQSAQSPAAARHALAALLPLDADLTRDHAQTLMRTVVQDRAQFRALLESLTPRWMHLAPERRAALVDAARHDAWSAQIALTCLAPLAGALTDEQTAACASAVARDREASAALIESLAPHWRRLDRAHARFADVIAATAHNPWTAQRALVALLPIDGALPSDHVAMLVAAVAAHADACAALIECSAAWWTRCAAALIPVMQHIAQDAWTAQRTLAALVCVDGALTPAHVQQLIAAIVRDAHASAALINALVASPGAIAWHRLDSSMQRQLVHAVQRDASAMLRALTALLPIDPALQRDCLGPGACDAIDDAFAGATLIDALAPHWTRLDPALRLRLIRAASGDPWTAHRACSALVALDAALTPMHAHMLISSIVRDHDACGACLPCIAPHWGRLDPETRRIALMAIQHPWTAQQMIRALIPLLPLARLSRAPQDDGRGGCALSLDEALMLGRAAFPAAAWEALTRAPCERRIALGVVVHHVVTWAIAPSDASAIRAGLQDAWHALDSADHIALARATSGDPRLAIALALAAHAHALPFNPHAQRIIARAIIPASDALAALWQLAATRQETGGIAAWLPDGAIDHNECAAWRSAIDEGILPTSVMAALLACGVLPLSPSQNNRGGQRGGTSQA